MSGDFDVIVVGAGAAGMMCAAQAGQRSRRVLLIDHATSLAEKIRISGGGRCNFTNIHCKPENFLSRNPRFCRSALARYTPQHFITLVEKHGIAWHEKTLGQLFCDDSSQQIIDMLKRECDRGGVRWCMPCAVRSVSRLDATGSMRFVVATGQGMFRCASLVIATGGLSIQKIGASPFGYRIAEQFGLAVVPPRPALVPLVLAPETLAHFGALSGASFDAMVACDGARFRENVLLTHRGLSGPAILQISSYWQRQECDQQRDQQRAPQREKEPIRIDLLPEFDATEWLQKHRASRALLPNLLAEHLPKRFAQQWCDAHGWSAPLSQMTNRGIDAIAQALKSWTLMPSGTLGFSKAEVTLGGVDTDCLSSKTMEAKDVAGLYFIGEVVDVTGHLGGFNFQWAWASGYAAGQYV